MRRSILFAALALTGAVVARDAWHPEWGPTPPVAPYAMALLPQQKVVIPLVFPVLGESRWDDGYNQVRGNFRHTGIDIRAPKMTPIVAPFSGKIGMKPMSFWIYGDKGWLMLGTHLNDDNLGQHDHKGGHDLMFAPDLHPGQHVVAGQFIGYVGESGDATAPHLHFEIYAPGEGPTAPRVRNPFPSLKAAKVIKAPVPTLDAPKDRPKAGEIRLEGCIRKVDEAASAITILLTAVQAPSGEAHTVTQPQYRVVKLSADEVKSVGGWSSMRAFASYQTVSVYIPNTPAPAVKLARVLTVHVR